ADPAFDVVKLASDVLKYVFHRLRRGLRAGDDRHGVDRCPAGITRINDLHTFSPRVRGTVRAVP
ncbi:MAG: hypothetical protein ACRDTT_26000, partial [Pseudonocardiaceae bacterium]